MRCAAVVSTCDLMSTGDVRGGKKVAEKRGVPTRRLQRTLLGKLVSIHSLTTWKQR